MLINADSRPKLIAGSPEGYVGHVDGTPREARMNHPKGFTVDGRGNIYVADTMNMAIRKISDTGKREGIKYNQQMHHSSLQILLRNFFVHKQYIFCTLEARNVLILINDTTSDFMPQ